MLLCIAAFGDVTRDAIDEALVRVREPRELAGLQHGAEGRRRRLAVVGVAHVEQRPPDDLLRCEPEHSLNPRVDAPHHAVERRDAHDVEGEVE